MKVVVIKSPKFLSGILRMIFKFIKRTKSKRATAAGERRRKRSPAERNSPVGE